MFLFNLFQLGTPMQNPLGFGVADWLELALALLFAAAILSRSRIQPFLERFAGRTLWSMLLVGTLPIAARLLLLPSSPAPIAGGADDLSYMLLADTLRHFRLANPVHPMHRFFEALFVLQEPSFASIFPAGQGIALALGWTFFGHPWAGVLLSMGGFCALCYWMLRGWTRPVWALAGGLLAAMEFGPLNQWTNTYWGGAVSGMAGCLVFGSLPRLRKGARTRDAILLGLGLGLQLLTRPFELVLMLGALALYWGIEALRGGLPTKRLTEAAFAAWLAFLPALGLTLAQNHAVTGNWGTLPYQVSRYQYGVPTTFTVQPLPEPHRELTRQQELDYQIQSGEHGEGTDTLGSYVERLFYRIRFYRFFFLAPLYLALPFFLARLRDPRFAWVAATLAIFALGTNIYPYFYQHYLAAAACLMLLVMVTGLETLSRLKLRGWPAGRESAVLLLLLAGAHFLFFYGVRLLGDEAAARSVARFESWDYINIGDAEGRRGVKRQLDQVPGKILLFVRYSPQHRFQEWLQNEADIDAGRIVWANDLGDAENPDLQARYPGRTSWLLEPDARPPRLRPYVPEKLDKIELLPIH